MKSFVFSCITLLIFCLVIMAGCQPTYEATKVTTDNILIYQEGYVLQAELFSKTISQQLEENDLDMLYHNIPSNR